MQGSTGTKGEDSKSTCDTFRWKQEGGDRKNRTKKKTGPLYNSRAACSIEARAFKYSSKGTINNVTREDVPRRWVV